MRKFIGILIIVLLSMPAMAQSEWKWPKDPEQEKIAKEKQAYYRVLMQTDKYEAALKELNWLFANTPDLHESIYQEGSKIIDKLLEGNLPKARTERLQDSLLWTFDMRMKYFDGKGSALDRKAYTAFRMYYKNPQKFPILRSMYDELYKYPYSEISDFNLVPYMTLATAYYKANPKELGPTDVLDIHDAITTVIEQKLAHGGNKEKLQKEQDKVDAFLSSGEQLITCQFIEENLVPKFKADRSNVNNAKKIFSYSITAKCTDKDYFTEAAEAVMLDQPSFSLSKTLGDKFYVAKNYTKALPYYTKAFELAADAQQKHDALMGMASCESKTGSKSKARSLARQALSEVPGSPEAYNLIGNMYFLSFEECKQGVSKVEDRAVFLAAYEMYKKAGNQDQMRSCKEQFPSIEEIFTEGKQEGDKITVGCWINETVTLMRR